MVLKSDNFDDNSRDASFWDLLSSAGGSANEVNQRLELVCLTSAGIAGYVTKDAHDLTECDITIDVEHTSLHSLELFLSLTKQQAANPYFESDWYRIMKYNLTNECYVQRRIAGVPTVLYNGAWTGASGSLRIVISGGTITFYEETIERASQSYALGSYNCYVYLYTTAAGGLTGTDIIDNFVVPSDVVVGGATKQYMVMTL